MDFFPCLKNTRHLVTRLVLVLRRHHLSPSCWLFPFSAAFAMPFNPLPTHLNLWAWWWRGPGYRRLGDWYSCDSRAWLVFWLGLLANLTVMGSAAPDGFCPFKPLMASSASILLSKRMKPTPREPPAGPADHKQTQAPLLHRVSTELMQCTPL